MSADEEAHWRGWQITQLWGGLGRVYRDPRFDTLRVRSDQADSESPIPLGPLPPEVPPGGER